MAPDVDSGASWRQVVTLAVHLPVGVNGPVRLHLAKLSIAFGLLANSRT